MKAKKMVIVGVGAVGATIAYTAFLTKLCNEIVLIDSNAKRQQAEFKDILHTVPYVGNDVKVISGDYTDVKDADFVIITAAAPVKFGQTRLDMIQKNMSIADAIIPEIVENGFNGTYIIISNPVDVMTYYICKKYNLCSEKVVGTGTVLDTGRLKNILAEHFNTDESAVDGFCLGEHGDSLVIPWSQITVDGQNIADKIEDKEAIRIATIHAAYDIVRGKGNTSYGIAISTLEIVKALLGNEDTVLPVSTLLTGQYGIKDVFLSVPAKLSNGRVNGIVDIDLTEKEIEELVNSSNILKETLCNI